MRWHSRVSGRYGAVPIPRAFRAHADCQEIPSGKRGASTHESPEKRMCDSIRRQCIIACSRYARRGPNSEIPVSFLCKFLRAECVSYGEHGLSLATTAREEAQGLWSTSRRAAPREMTYG